MNAGQPAGRRDGGHRLGGGGGSCRSAPDHEHARRRVAPAGGGPAPVGLIGVGGPPGDGDLLAPGHEPRAAPAGHQLAFQLELRGRDQNAQGQIVLGLIPQLKQTLEILVSNRGGVMYDVARGVATSEPTAFGVNVLTRPNGSAWRSARRRRGPG